MVFHAPHESHSVEFESRVRILGVQFSFEKLASIREQTCVLDSPTSCRRGTLAWLASRLSRELRRRHAASLLAIEGLILEILAEAVRSGADAPEGIRQRGLTALRIF